MPRKCTVCYHERRGEIDRALVDNAPLRNIAERFSLSVTALHRHKADHLPDTLTQAAQANEVARADSLLDQVRSLQGKALAILDKAEKAGDLRTALQAISQARGNLELLAKLLGELQDQPANVNVLVTSPDWLRLRSVILTALESYPEARLAVGRALDESISR